MTKLPSCFPCRFGLLSTMAMMRAALSRHWQLAVPFYGDPRRALPHARMHAIKYGQYHRDAGWARDRLVTMRGPEHWTPLVDEVFADRFDAGRVRELTAADAVETVEVVAETVTADAVVATVAIGTVARPSSRRATLNEH